MKWREEQKEVKARKENTGREGGAKEREGCLEGSTGQRCRQRTCFRPGRKLGKGRRGDVVTGLLFKGSCQPSSNCWCIKMASPTQLEAAFLTSNSP